MKLAVFLIVALFLSLLSFSASYDVISNGEGYMKINQVTMRFQDDDAVISVSYGLDMFSSMYVFLMGAHNLEPSISNFFFDFEEMEIIEIGKDHAVISANNISRENDEYYLHDSHGLGSKVRILMIVYPDGSTRTIYNTNTTPDTFYTG